MEFLLKTPGEREKIGPAWFLFFDVAYQADSGGLYTAMYSELAKRYGVAAITVKKWRQHLFRRAVIESFSRGRSVAFRLLEPYRSFIKASDKEEHKEPCSDEELSDLLALKRLFLKSVKVGTTKIHV